jgi:hypothetical protein
MENFPKKRGRPRKIPRSENTMRDLLGKEAPGPGKDFAVAHFAEAIQSERSRANQHYADLARETVESLADPTKLADPSDPFGIARTRRGMDWILSRRTVLTELGRMMSEDPKPGEIEHFQFVVYRVASRHENHTAKTAVAYIRGQRLGSGPNSKDRVAALHHDLNAAINLYRQRHPETTWADVRRAVKMTADQVAGKRGRAAGRAGLCPYPGRPGAQ